MNAALTVELSGECPRCAHGVLHPMRSEPHRFRCIDCGMPYRADLIADVGDLIVRIPKVLHPAIQAIHDHEDAARRTRPERAPLTLIASTNQQEAPAS